MHKALGRQASFYSNPQLPHYSIKDTFNVNLPHLESPDWRALPEELS